ncbi:MAG: FkbM family methyltransferase [Magnetospirillum sp.]|nr:FkbM family methyltransferase [Magnetospirillum sp.]
MSFKEKALRIIERQNSAETYQLRIPPGSLSLAIDLPRLKASPSVSVVAEAADSGNAVQVCRSILPHLAAGTALHFLILDAPEQMMAGELDQLVWSLQSLGLALVDMLGSGRDVLVAFRSATTLDAEEMEVWISRDGAEVSLLHSEANDLLRRYPILGKCFYEQELLDHVAGRSRGGVFVDIGANMGNHTVFLAGLAQMRGYAFEPDPQVFACLERNIVVNGLSDKVMPFALALGDHEGTARLVHKECGNSGATQFAAGPGTTRLQRLDTVLAGIDRLDVVKIDVEGMEREVIEGSSGLLSRFQPDLYVEVLDDDRLGGIERILEPFGYTRIRRHCGNPTWEFRAQSRG